MYIKWFPLSESNPPLPKNYTLPNDDLSQLGYDLSIREIGGQSMLEMRTKIDVLEVYLEVTYV